MRAHGSPSALALRRQGRHITRASGNPARVYVDFRLIGHDQIEIPSNVTILLQDDEYQHSDQTSNDGEGIKNSDGRRTRYSAEGESSREQRLFDTMDSADSLLFIRFKPHNYRVNECEAPFIAFDRKLDFYQDALSNFDFSALVWTSSPTPQSTMSTSTALLAHVDALRVVAQADVHVLTMDGRQFASIPGPDGPEIVGFAIAEARGASE